MAFRYIYLCVVTTVALASSTMAQSASRSSVRQPLAEMAPWGTYVIEGDSADEVVEEEVEGVAYDLRLAQKAPTPDTDHKGFDVVEFTVTNAGSDPSPETRIAVDVITLAKATHAKDVRLVGGALVPKIPPGEHVTVRVQVPRVKNTRVCYVGKIVVPR